MNRAALNFFRIGCLLELALIGAATLLARWFGVPLWEEFDWQWRDAAVGAAAALPPLLFLLLTLHAPVGPLKATRRSLVEVVRPLLARWTVPQMAVVSMLAGLGEELFFRGLIQGGLTPSLGVTWAVGLASAVFGALHLLDPAYGVGAALIGAYLSGWWLGTGNLLTPVVTHAVYDFLALIYLLRVHRDGTG
jgi:membrane protease YdiL (CAAX protease family)